MASNMDSLTLPPIRNPQFYASQSQTQMQASSECWDPAAQALVLLQKTKAIRDVYSVYYAMIPQYATPVKVNIVAESDSCKPSHHRYRHQPYGRPNDVRTSRRYRVIRTPYYPTNWAGPPPAAPPMPQSCRNSAAHQQTRTQFAAGFGNGASQGSNSQSNKNMPHRQSSQPLQQGSGSKTAIVGSGEYFQYRSLVTGVGCLSDRSNGRWECQFVRPDNGHVCRALFNSARELIYHFHDDHRPIAVTNPPYWHPCMECGAYNNEFTHCVKCAASAQSTSERWVCAFTLSDKRASAGSSSPYIPDLEEDDDEDEGYLSPRDVALPSVEKEEAFRVANLAMIQPGSALGPVFQDGGFTRKFHAVVYDRPAFDD